MISTQARSAYLRTDYPASLALAHEAYEMAESLGLEPIRAEALVYIGGSKFDLGDDSGIDDLRRSIEISDAINSPDSARAYNNLGVLYRIMGDLPAAFESWDEGLRVAERFGLEPYIAFDRTGRPYRHFEAGEWDEALRGANAIVEESPARSGHAWMCRALIRLARGEDEGALEDTARAVEDARRDGYPQAIYPATGTRAFVLASIGDLEAAETLVDELAALRHEHFTFQGGIVPIWTWVRLGRAGEFLARFQTGRRTPWLEAAEAAGSGDWLRAAELYRTIGTRADEAFALLQAGGDGPLGTALEFYRSVRATRYIREAEAKLAAIA